MVAFYHPRIKPVKQQIRENVLILWFIHIYKAVHLQQLKGNAKVGMWKGYPGLCSSRALWPLAPNFCPRATRKSQIFHTNHMPGTLDFTVSEHWAPFNFPAQLWVPFVDRECTERVLFLSKMPYKRVRSWTSERSLPEEDFVEYPPGMRT